jgi:uncharacterized membrane protein YdbT with pleckstrin-like domain
MLRSVLLVVGAVVLIFACLGVLMLAGGTLGVDDRAAAELVQAEAELVQAEAEEMRNRTELERARAERVRVEAEADALRTRSEELVKHSRLNRRLLVYSVARGDVLVVLLIVLVGLNLATWGAGLFLFLRQQGGER